MRGDGDCVRDGDERCDDVVVGAENNPRVCVDLRVDIECLSLGGEGARVLLQLELKLVHVFEVRILLDGFECLS